MDCLSIGWVESLNVGLGAIFWWKKMVCIGFLLHSILANAVVQCRTLSRSAKTMGNSLVHTDSRIFCD